LLQDRTLRLWNPHKGFAIKTYAGHGYEVRDVSVSVDNSQMASVGGDKQVFLWDVASGKVIRKFKGHDSRVNAVRPAEWQEACSSRNSQQQQNQQKHPAHADRPPVTTVKPVVL